jgi:hypothetical protein
MKPIIGIGRLMTISMTLRILALSNRYKTRAKKLLRCR